MKCSKHLSCTCDDSGIDGVTKLLPAKRSMETKTIACPFCLSEINSDSYVCKFCRQDVKKVLELQREVDELKKLLEAKGIPKPDPVGIIPVVVSTKVKPDFNFPMGVIILLFLLILSVSYIYLIWFASRHHLITILGLEAYQIIVACMIPPLILLFYNLNKSINVLPLVVISFFIPNFALELLNTISFIDIDYDIGILGNLTVFSFLLGIVTLLSGFMLVRLFKDAKLSLIVGYTGLTNYFTESTDYIEKLDRLFLAIVSLTTAIISILKMLSI